MIFPLLAVLRVKMLSVCNIQHNRSDTIVLEEKKKTQIHVNQAPAVFFSMRVFTAVSFCSSIK